MVWYGILYCIIVTILLLYAVSSRSLCLICVYLIHKGLYYIYILKKKLDSLLFPFLYILVHLSFHLWTSVFYFLLYLYFLNSENVVWAPLFLGLHSTLRNYQYRGMIIFFLLFLVWFFYVLSSGFDMRPGPRFWALSFEFLALFEFWVVPLLFCRLSILGTWRLFVSSRTQCSSFIYQSNGSFCFFFFLLVVKLLW